MRDSIARNVRALDVFLAYFQRPAVQFSTMVIDDAFASSTMTLIKKR